MLEQDIQNNKQMHFADNIIIFDTTLRDGEQAPGVALTVDEKIQIAQKLDNIGVNKIECGFPAASKGELEVATKINSLGLNSEIVGLARALKKDIDAVIDADLSYIHTFIGTSPLHRDYKLHKSKDQINELIVDAVQYAKDHGLTVEFSAEDATRTERDYLIEAYKFAEDAGADFLNVPDTVGVLTPFNSYELITDLKNNLNTPLSVHFHNDFGQATANTLMALEAGASQAHLTINGIGERCGNTSLEEVVVSLLVQYGIKVDIDTTQLYNISDFVGRITGIKMPLIKPIVGDNAFAHESGIHVQGIINNASTYEPIPPELVGHSRRIALGKLTGTNAIKAKLDEFNIDLTDEQFNNVYNKIKSLGDKGKKITDSDLKAIAITEINTIQDAPIKLLGLGVMSGGPVSSTATVKLEIYDEIFENSSTGVGPVDAAINAIKSLTHNLINIDLEEYSIEAITGGTNALAEVFVISSDNMGNKAIGRATNDDIVMASVSAVLDSINKILIIQSN